VTNEHDSVIEELKKHPSALISAYEAVADEVADALGPAPALRWAQQGVRIASQGPRAWEAATEYFKASPQVVQTIGFTQFERWAESGIELTAEAPVIAASFFRASPRVLPTLAPRHIAGWAGLGRGLSKGTWKSSSLAARFFDVSDELVQQVNFHELQLFVSLVQTLASRSYDLAAEALVLGQRVLPAVSEREELLDGRFQVVLDGAADDATGIEVSWTLVWLLGREGEVPLAEGYVTVAAAAAELNASLDAGNVETSDETGAAAVRARFVVDAAEGDLDGFPQLRGDPASGARVTCDIEVGTESWSGELRLEPPG